MKVVVDTNIVFSALLNTSSDFGKILVNTNPAIKFFSCNFLQEEILLNKQKLLRLTKLDQSSLEELLHHNHS